MNEQVEIAGSYVVLAARQASRTSFVLGMVQRRSWPSVSGRSWGLTRAEILRGFSEGAQVRHDEFVF